MFLIAFINRQSFAPFQFNRDEIPLRSEFES